MKIVDDNSKNVSENYRPLSFFLQKYFKGDKTIWMIYLLLCVVSLLEVFSAIGTLAYANMNPYKPIIRHAGFLLFGAVLILVLHNFHYKFTALLVYPFMLCSLVMLLLIQFSSVGVSLNEAERWINIFGIRLQPSEVAKFSMMLYSAWTLGRAQSSPQAMEKAFWKVLAWTALFALLIVGENLSTALLLGFFIYLMLIIAGAPKKNIWILTGIVGGLAVLGIFLLLTIPEMPMVPRWETWHNRLVTEQMDVKNPAFRIDDDNYQESHSKMAIAQGKFIGVMPGNSSQRDFLPQAYSDFIYAIIIEDLGWLGLFGIPALYLFLLFRCLRIAKNCQKSVPMLLVLGSALLVSLQAFINMSVAVGFFPVTGQPLPLISRGGTSGIITCLYFAVILSVSRFVASEDEAVVFAAEAQEEAAAMASAGQTAADYVEDVKVVDDAELY